MNVALEWDLEGDIDSALLLKALKVSDSLSWGLNLDGKRLNYSNNVESTAKDLVLCEGGIKLPDGHSGFNMGDFRDNIHELGDGQVDNVGEAG